jgi:hypothetical protein
MTWLASSTQAQATGPLSISENSLFALANKAPSLSLDGNTLAARELNFFGSPPTTAHVFTRSFGVWSEFQSFSVPGCGPQGAANTMSVSVRGAMLVIGVTDGVEAQGDARISQFSGGSWGPLTVVPLPDDFNNFGATVLTREGLAFVGEPDTSIGIDAVHIYRQNASNWNLVASLPDPGGSSNVYGTMLADSGDTLLVGGNKGVDVRVRGATSIQWNHQALLEPANTFVITSIAIDGDTAVVGYLDQSTGGSAAVYERSGTTWTLAAPLTGSDTLPTNQFGASAGIHGDTIYVGAPAANSNQGAVYVFQRQSGAWGETAKLVPASPVANGQFGETLAVDGATLAVGANASVADAAGSLYLFDIAALARTQIYCMAKVNSQGCLPQIGAEGIPGATNPNPFAITATNVINHKSGFVLYSVAGMAAMPFQGGTLCLAFPLHRTPAQNSGGSAGPTDCSGTYSFDFNARVQSGIDHALLPGVEVWAQYYSRDPGDPFMVGLTDAVTFTIGS